MKPLDDYNLQCIEIAANKEPPFTCKQDTLFLLAEIRRLKSGDFTEAEFQNLCHKFDCSDRERFEKGCKEYQDKLFGKRQVLPGGFESGLSGRKCPTTGLPIECVDPKEYE